MDIKEKEASEVFYSYSGQNAMNSDKQVVKNYSLLSVEEMNIVKVNIAEQNADIDKIKKATEFCRSKQLNTVQVEEIIKLFLFESTRLDFIKSIHNQIVDKENIKVLKTYFELNSSKEAIDSL
jgi:RNA-binding protein YhbY